MELDIDFSAELKAASGHLSDIDKYGKKRNRALPVMRTCSFEVIATAASPTIVPIGSPAVGRVWSPRLFTITGWDDHTVVAGSSWAVYIGDPINLSLSQCVIPATLGTVPGFYDLGRDVLWIQSEETAFFVVNSAGNGQQIVGNMKVMEFEMDAVTPSMIP